VSCCSMQRLLYQHRQAQLSIDQVVVAPCPCLAHCQCSPVAAGLQASRLATLFALMWQVVLPLPDSSTARATAVLELAAGWTQALLTATPCLAEAVVQHVPACSTQDQPTAPGIRASPSAAGVPLQRLQSQRQQQLRPGPPDSPATAQLSPRERSCSDPSMSPNYFRS